MEYCIMYDVRIINNQAILFKDNNQVANLRKEGGIIRYEFDDGSYVRIFGDNTIMWFDFDGNIHRNDGDMPAYIKTNGYMSYCKHGKGHRENGPALIWPSGRAEYYLDGINYHANQYVNELNSSYGCILCMM